LTKSGLFTEEKDSGKLRSYILLSKAFHFLDLHLTVGWENNKKGLRSSLTTWIPTQDTELDPEFIDGNWWIKEAVGMGQWHSLPMLCQKLVF
jgi:hypothetical protein